MVDLSPIAGSGALAHTIVDRSLNRPADAARAWTATDSSQAGGVAAIITGLLQGDLSAQGQTIHTSQATISMLQTFDAAAGGILSTLTRMAALATSAQSGVYSDAQKALMQSGIQDLAGIVNAVAGATEVNGYRLLAGDATTVTLYVGNNTTAEIASADLTLDAGALDLTTDAAGALSAINAAISETAGYRACLSGQMDRLASQVAIADTEIGRQIGYGDGIPNADLATQMALEVVSQMLSESVVTIKALVDPSRIGAASLLHNG
jgi:flagellin